MSLTLETSATEPEASTGKSLVAMVGAGQLARMTHEAAIKLGIRVRVLAESDRDPAVLAGAEHVIGRPDSIEDLCRLAEGADVLTFDHEGVPPEMLSQLEGDGIRMAPSRAAKLMAQDKLHARISLNELGYPVPPFEAPVDAGAALRFAEDHGLPITVKAARGGYDGKGVWQVSDPGELERLLENPANGLILEPTLDILQEIAVIVVRSTNGERVTYPTVETVQRDAMCREILAPAKVSSSVAARAQGMATDIAEDIDATGILAVEFFLTSEGLLVNELALRPHNSGHYTMEGCVTSQFEQHLRAVLGLPLGLPSLVSPSVVTVNVVGNHSGGDPRRNLGMALGIPGAQIHLYDKEPRPGRKLGHVTICGQDQEPTRKAALMAARVLEGGRP
jgi:5-(carboxyamino)imidazole ribonucleotide synthase